MIRIALTGGIAAGKSTVSRYLAQLGFGVIDYDEITHELQQAGSFAIEPLRNAFGNEVINAEGAVNRKALAAQVFGDDAMSKAALQQLDSIMHPLIEQLVAEREQAIVEHWQEHELPQYASHSSAVVVHDIPLYTEVHQTIPLTFDHVVTVEAPEEQRIQRMIQTRDMTREQAEARIANQATQAQREALADEVIDGSVTKEQMYEAVDELMQQWLTADEVVAENVQNERNAQQTSSNQKHE
ncbi:dephospho-CoA kinase [Bifidobacterium dolichotidis]|uniref:Dephospho-CoA kinase n=1 Tax=Bifidobacterium dolichotidis TaxID=2306976 RepID=A0A430FSR1_9BIFI|nr:dephospho-CoA kinase [Bifidobacterium dolichotidis]RSX55891.1 dephospho-CoA kinase [Bifidobacterium dolichotidis]